MNKTLKIFSLFLVLIMTSCQALDTTISGHAPKIQTRVAETIFLDPVALDKQIVFVQVRNTSGYSDLNIAGAIKTSLMERGYRIADNPDKAYYILQANVLSAGTFDGNKLKGGDLGSAGDAGSILLGGAAGYLVSGDSRGAMIGGLAGAAVSSIANALIKNMIHAVVVDIQLSQKAQTAYNIKETARSAQGMNSTISSDLSETSKWKKYRTQVVSYMEGSNLKFEDAASGLVKALSSSVGGMF